MNLDSKGFRHAIENAAAYKLVGQEEIYLNDGHEKPWHLTNSVEPGGSHRLEISTSVWFRGRDPVSGMKFRWAFDLEPSSANGKGHYEIDRDGAREVLRQLPEAAKVKFRQYLFECADKIENKAREFQTVADRQFADAAIFRELSR